MSKDRQDKGRALLEQLCGKADAVDGLPSPLRDYTLEHLFGDVWQGEALALEERCRDRSRRAAAGQEDSGHTSFRLRSAPMALGQPA